MRSNQDSHPTPRQAQDARIAQLEAFVQKFLDNFEECDICEGKGQDETEGECTHCLGTGQNIVSYGVLYIELPEEARRLLDGAK